MTKSRSIILAAILVAFAVNPALGVQGEGYFGPENPAPYGIIPELTSVTVPYDTGNTGNTGNRNNTSNTGNTEIVMPEPPRPKQQYEKYSEDPGKVIRSYGLSETQTSDLLDLHHAATRGAGNVEKSNRYTEILNRYPMDYFAAYQNAKVNYDMAAYSIAKMWNDKALEIFPQYMPARNFRKKIEGGLKR